MTAYRTKAEGMNASDEPTEPKKPTWFGRVCCKVFGCAFNEPQYSLSYLKPEMDFEEFMLVNYLPSICERCGKGISGFAYWKWLSEIGDIQPFCFFAQVKHQTVMEKFMNPNANHPKAYKVAPTPRPGPGRKTPG